MNQYELFTCSWFLSDWPEGWTFTQIIDALRNGTEGEPVVAWQPFDDMVIYEPNEFVNMLEGFVDSLRSQFKAKS